MMTSDTFDIFKANARAAFAILFAACVFSLSISAQKEYSIAEIQGDKNISPYVGENVRVGGVVTARTRTGFFLQTPDERIDDNPATSEGIFVFTKNEPPSDAGIGNTVEVTGTVEEYRPRNDENALTVTEVSFRFNQDTVKLISKGSTLPKPVVITKTDFTSNSINQLERYEGMRISIPEMSVVAPTGGRVDIKTASAVSDGVFFGVLKSLPRPFREPGLDIRDFLSSPDKDDLKKNFPKLQTFDANPEIIRVDSDEQTFSKSFGLGEDAKTKGMTSGFRPSVSPMDVTSQSEIKGLVGVLHYSFGRYTLLKDIDNYPAVSKSIKANPLPVPPDRQFSIAGMNLESLFDDQDDPNIKEDVLTTEAFQKRLKKVSMAVRNYMQMPDVIGTVEVENLSTLKRLADKINADAAASGKPDPKYEAFLIDGNDGRGIDNGFLVKSSRVKVLELRQFGKNDKFENANTKEDNFLNDRPPLMLRASINEPKTDTPFEFTLVVNHLKSLLGYNDPKQKDNVRRKKLLQAEFLAKFVQERLKANPGERIALLGDFNAFQFNDGVMDVIGTIKGKPAAKDEVLLASNEALNPDLTDLVDVINVKERYSYIYDGNAQVIDHILISEAFKKYVRAFGFARLNADYPESYRNDGSRVERFSDHDPAVAYFSFDASATSK